MARIEFVPDLRREGACGTWGAILLGDGGLCAAMRLPVVASDRETIDRVLTAIREVMRAGVPGIAPIADVAVGGDQVWVFVGIAPGPSVADLLYEVTLAPADLALIALDSGRTLARLHHSGLWHGAFGADTIVATRTGAIHLTEAGLGPALDGIDVRIGQPRVAAAGRAGVVGGSRVAVIDEASRDASDKVIAANGAARSGAVRAGGTSIVAESTEPADAVRWDAATGGPSAAGPVPLTDGAHVDATAWADTVRLFASHLRAARAEAEADVLAACARRADDAGIAAALAELELAAQTFAGFPGRGGLEAAMSEYAIEDEPDSDTILRAIDALFEAALPPTPPPPSLPRRFRSPLGRGRGSNGAVADGKATHPGSGERGAARLGDGSGQRRGDRRTVGGRGHDGTAARAAEDLGDPDPIAPLTGGLADRGTPGIVGALASAQANAGAAGGFG
jgi:hypothetical protein